MLGFTYQMLSKLGGNLSLIILGKVVVLFILLSLPILSCNPREQYVPRMFRLINGFMLIVSRLIMSFNAGFSNDLSGRPLFLALLPWCRKKWLSPSEK